MECTQKENLSSPQVRAWINREFKVAAELLRRLNDHEATCPKCKALQRGTGLAGGLFKNAILLEASNE